MLSRVQQSLSHVTQVPGEYYSEEYGDYEQRPVRELKQTFTQQPTSAHPDLAHKRMTAVGHTPGYVPRQSAWKKPPPTYGSLPTGLLEPGWTPVPGQQHQPQQARYGRTRGDEHAPQSHSPAEHHHHQSPPVNRTHQQRMQVQHSLESDEPPAWAGSLRSAGGLHNIDLMHTKSILHGANMSTIPATPDDIADTSRARRRVQSQPPQDTGSSYGVEAPRSQRAQQQARGHQQQQQQQQPMHQRNGGGQTMQLGNRMQYNSPIGLYSTDTVRETMVGRTPGQPGYETMQVINTSMNPYPGEDTAPQDTYDAVMQEEGDQHHYASAPVHPLHRSQAPPAPQYRQHPASMALHQNRQVAAGPQRHHYDAHVQNEGVYGGGHVNQISQSPSMYALSAQYDDDAGQMGVSDY